MRQKSGLEKQLAEGAIRTFGERHVDMHMRDGRGVSLATLAAAAGLERRTLLRRFASATGMAPIEYCRSVRVARARELLECGETSLKQIAESPGYKDVASFARAFRKAVGSAPAAYRKRFAGKGVSLADFAAQDGSRQKKHLFEAGARAD
jgi:AraC-like DNA-binding protein